ncbi:MAG: glycosyltransferase family 39 protein [bacterium]
MSDILPESAQDDNKGFYSSVKSDLKRAVKLEKARNLIFLGICFGLVFIIYSQSLFGGFVYDDRSIVEHYEIFKDINNIGKVVLMPYWNVEAGLYRPTTLLSYLFNYSFFGQGAWSFHLFNLICYGLTCYLIFLFIKNLFLSERIGYLTALLFLVLPIHTEAVANIVGRAEILALLFSLLVFLELIKEKPCLWKTGLWFLLALGSKETAIAVLPIALLIIFFKKGSGKITVLRREGKFKEYFYNVAFLIFAAASYFIARFLVLGDNFFTNSASIVENPLKFVHWPQRIATALKITAMYVGKSFVPINLCSDYSYKQVAIVGFSNWQAIAGFLILLFFALGIIIFLGRAPVLSIAFSFFLFSFLVTSNLLMPIGTIAGERLVYFPSLGLCLFLAWGLIAIGRLNSSKISGIFSLVLSGILIFSYAGISFARSFVWLNEERLFISAAKCAPNSVLSVSNLGTLYYFSGDYEKAQQIFLEANAIYDGYSKAINNLGLVYWKKKEYNKAKEYFFKALMATHPYSGAIENLFLMALSRGREAEAERWREIFY